MQLFANDSTDSILKKALGGNRISELPAAIGDLHQLTTLHLSRNNLTRLPDAMGRLQRLAKLSLTGNPLPDSEKDKIRNMLPGCHIEV